MNVAIDAMAVEIRRSSGTGRWSESLPKPTSPRTCERLARARTRAAWSWV